MNAIAYDIRPRPELTGELGFRYVAFEELLAGSDIISLHANLNLARPRVAARDRLRAKEIEKLMRLGSLLLRPEVVCTPHTAFNCVEAIERINRVTVENIKAFVGGTPINTLSSDIAPERAETPAAVGS